MANSDYLIAGNDEHGLEPLPTVGGIFNPRYYIFFLFNYKFSWVKKSGRYTNFIPLILPLDNSSRVTIYLGYESFMFSYGSISLFFVVGSIML